MLQQERNGAQFSNCTQRPAYIFSFLFSDGRNIIGLHIAVAAACSVGVFWAAKAY